MATKPTPPTKRAVQATIARLEQRVIKEIGDKTPEHPNRLMRAHLHGKLLQIRGTLRVLDRAVDLGARTGGTLARRAEVAKWRAQVANELENDLRLFLRRGFTPSPSILSLMTMTADEYRQYIRGSIAGLRIVLGELDALLALPETNGASASDGPSGDDDDGSANEATS